jgi:hypothetical protein
MVDRIELCQDALELIRNRASDGATMIATCRAIFSADYSDEIHNSGLLDVFQLICDDSGSIILSEFGNFNRVYQSVNWCECEDSESEIKNIYDFYLLQFEADIEKFRIHFGITVELR